MAKLTINTIKKARKLAPYRGEVVVNKERNPDDLDFWVDDLGSWRLVWTDKGPRKQIY